MRVTNKGKAAVFVIAFIVLIGVCISAANVFGALDVSGAESIARGGSGEAEWKGAPHNGRHSTWETPGSGFMVPAEYANKLKKTGAFQAVPFGKTCRVQSLKDLYGGRLTGREDDTHFCFDIAENSKGNCGIWLRNIAIYDNERGRDVELDCRLSVMDWVDETRHTPEKHHVVLSKTKALPGVDISGLYEIRLKWDYYEAGTNKPYRLKSNVTFYDIDSSQYMGFQVDQALYQFADADTELKFKSTGGYSLYTDPEYGNDDAMDPKQAFGLAYESSSVRYTYGTFTDGTFSAFGELAYSMFKPTPNDPTKRVSDGDEEGQKQVLLSGLSETITYDVQQVVANGYSPDTYMKSFVMEDKLEDCLEILSAKVQQNGADTDLFTVTTDGQTVRAEAKASALNTAAFYNKRYDLLITAKLKKDITLKDLQAYKKVDMISIPNTGKVTIDDTPRITNETEVRLWDPKPEKRVSDSDETKVLANTVSSRLEPFVYTVSQRVPEDVSSLTYLEFSDTVEECMEVKKVRVLENNTDVSGRWDIQTSQNKVRASIRNLRAAAAGKSYDLEITVQVRNVPDEVLQEHGHYSGDKQTLLFHNTGSMKFRLAEGDEWEAATNRVTTALRLPTDIAVTKDVNRYEHQVGDPIRYTVSIVHGTPDCEATDLVVRDTDLGNFDLDLSDAEVKGVTEYTLKPVKGGWEFQTPRLAEGKTVTIAFTAKAKKILNGTIAPNRAAVKCFGVPEKSDKEEVYINSPKLKVTKETDRKKYRVGDTMDYTLEISQLNKGCFMRDVILTDTVETEGVKILPGTVIVLDKDGKDRTASMDVTIRDRAITIRTNRNLSDGSERIPPKDRGKEPYKDLELTGYLKVCYSAKAASDRLSAAEIINKAELPTRPNTNGEPIKNDPDIPSGGDEAEHRAPVAGAELRIEKNSDKKQYQVGETGIYTVKAEQTREDYRADRVVIQDQFQQKGVLLDKDSLKVVHGKADITKTCRISFAEGGYEIETGRSLAYGETMGVTYKARFASKELKDTEVTNEAAVRADNAAEKETDHTVEIGDVPVSLEIEKNSDKQEYEPGEPIKYSLKVTSTGTYKAEKVEIADELKTEGLSLDPKSIRVADQKGADLTEECGIEASDHSFRIETGRDLEPGQWLSVTYTASADESLRGKEAENLAAAKGENTPEKETDHKVDIRDTASGLQIVKESDKACYEPGETIRYALTVTATGPEPAKNAAVEDEIKSRGVLLDAASIAVKNSSGADITKACHIETTERSFRIETQRDLKAGDWIRVTYEAEAGKSLAGKEVDNAAAASADNTDPAQDEHTVIIDPLPDVPAETKPRETDPSSEEDRQESLNLYPDKEKRQEGLRLSGGGRGSSGTAQTGDESSMIPYVLLANAAAVILILCLLGRRKKQRHR